LKIDYEHQQKFHYLSVAGKFLTANTTVVTSPTVITGALASSTITDWVSTPNHRELAINFTVQSVSGVSPTLSIFLDVLDPIEANNGNFNSGQNPSLVSILLNASQITAVSCLRVVLANGQLTVWQQNASKVLGNFSVPFKWQIRLVIGGTSPSFSIVGTYEARV
jgi:hypothetical protein